jgi:hypothetical protein
MPHESAKGRAAPRSATRWTVVIVVLRALVLLFALAGLADLLFFGDDYRRASPSYYTHYSVTNGLLVFLACYPRALGRVSLLLLLPLTIGSVIGAYELNWLARHEVLNVAAGDAVLKNGLAVLVLAFAVESGMAFRRRIDASL